ncbi:hypothetical protein CLAIMM_00870 [Cladophialophora immunda]|nr:hypothetical protein CLAIMM_00870 [Cladophialophora immunda]
MHNLCFARHPFVVGGPIRPRKNKPRELRVLCRSPHNGRADERPLIDLDSVTDRQNPMISFKRSSQRLNIRCFGTARQLTPCRISAIFVDDDMSSTSQEDFRPPNQETKRRMDPLPCLDDSFYLRRQPCSISHGCV